MNYPYQQQQQFIPTYRQQIQPQYNWNMMNQQPIPQVRPVSSIEEVKASSIDFDGSVFYFPDIANKKIYTKQINYDGTSTINMYELKPIPMETPGAAQFVTRDEFETIVKRIEERLIGLSAIETAGTQPQSAPQQANSPDDQGSPQFNF